MTVIEIIYSLLLGPLVLLFEFIYMAAYKMIENPGLSIIALSLVMNLLILPLYMRADKMQEEERETEKRLHPMVAHIKKTFSGDERMMMLQTYYRQNNYKPTYALKSAVSLFLEIPFFIAAYRFLSNLELLKGVSFGPISDLGQADGLLNIGGHAINLLPIIMTAVNLVSCVIFTKGSPLKTKIQLYAMAIFFLFFLYTSPSGLVFYWTLNNVFSLIKTVFYKLKDPKKVLVFLSAALGAFTLFFGAFFYGTENQTKKTVVLLLGICLLVPVAVRYGSRFIAALGKNKEKKPVEPNKKLFTLCSVYLALLTGLMIPTGVMSSSANEFYTIFYFYHPIWYIVNSACIAAGLFVIWAGVFYRLVSPKAKIMFERAALAICFIATANSFLFGRKLSWLTSILEYEGEVVFSRTETIMNVLLIVILAIDAVLLHLRVFRLRNVRWDGEKITVFQQKIIKCVIFTALSFGLYLIYWTYNTVKNVKALKNDFSDSKAETALLLLVPFYSYYWWYKRGGFVENALNEKGYSCSDMKISCMIFDILGLKIFSLIIMQINFNGLLSEPCEEKRKQTEKKSKTSSSGNPFYAIKVLGLMIFTVAALSAVYLGIIFYDIGNVNRRVTQGEKMPEFTLSKDGKNVVVIMLDRAMGEFVPNLYKENPELFNEKFEGFTAYTNVLSFGGNTNFGSPALFGGYEYTPWEMNKRDDEKLVDKHNEALKVMPVMFSDEGYDVTVIDPPYANYQEKPDISIFDEYDDIDAYLLEGRFTDIDNWNVRIEIVKRNFFCYSMMKIAPVSVQKLLYDNGQYFRSDTVDTGEMAVSQNRIDKSHSKGMSGTFMDEYNDLKHLSSLTGITDSGNTYLSLTFNITHNPMLLKESEDGYYPVNEVDNSEYDREHEDRFTYNGVTLNVDSGWKMAHYQTDMLAMETIGKWLDYLRDNGVYDNTRIIITSDHGYYLWLRDDYRMKVETEDDLYVDIDNYKPFLFVKDFTDEDERPAFRIEEEEFMTNADVPSLAVKDLIDDPKNPFTEKTISMWGKESDNIYVFNSERYFSIKKNNGNQFKKDRWYVVRNHNVNDPANWEVVAEESFFPVKD